MTAHTPGLWRPSFGNLIRVFPADAGRDRSPICGVHLRGLDGTYDQRRAVAEANAQLIAAAPDMLRALKAFVNDVSTAKAEARAAIAKAEGRQP